jgi:DNA-binding transcriptional ArsR family regulator/alpha-ketoglutarate-dependent taurine dioxygenase/acyl carrier protein
MDLAVHVREMLSAFPQMGQLPPDFSQFLALKGTADCPVEDGAVIGRFDQEHRPPEREIGENPLPYFDGLLAKWSGSGTLDAFDRRALAAAAAEAVPEGSADGAVPSPEGPRNALEENVVRIFAEVLQADRVGVNDSFFALGGHSLLATRAVYELGRVLDVQLPLRSIFDHRTPAELAALVAREYPAEAEGVIAGRQLTRGDDAPSGAADAALSEADRIPKVPADRTEHPVSFSQRRMWLVHALRPDDVSYHVQVAVRIRGPLDPARLRRTLELLADRHDALRTAFGPADGSGEPVQRVAERVEIPLPLTELPGEGGVQEYLRTQTDLPFDLSRPPLVRAGLARLSDEEHVLALTMHHIIVDEWSVSVLLRELTSGYASLTGGRPPQLAELPARYVDFATWQRRHLAGDRLRELEEHWRRELAGAPFEISLPFDRERPAVPTGRGGRVSLDLDQELAAALSVLAGRTNTTLFMVLLAAFATLLRHHSGQQDLVIGTPVANRPHHEVQDVVGFFSNVVVLRNDLSGDPAFEGLLARTRDAALRAYAHQELPFEKLVEALRPDRALGRVPLVQTWFVLHNAPLPELRSGAAVFELLDMDRSTAKFDLNLGVTETDRGLVAAIEYSADLFDQATADRLLRQYRAILGAAARAPGARLSEVIRQSGETDRRERSVASAERRQASLKSFSAFASNKVKAIQVAPEKLVTVTRLRPEQPLPVVIEPAAPDVELAGWISTHRDTVTRHLRGPGSVLFRGFGLAGVDDFQKVVQAYSDHMLDYYERSTPRQEVSGKVYTSTEYPPERHIPLHNESAYSHFWPRTLWFCCLQEPGGGGATPLADSRTILKLLDEGLVRRFRERKVMYVRNYHEGFDIPWHVAFQTEDREAVADYCRRVGMDFEWTPAGVLRTRQIFDAVVRHPETGEQVWFNQVYASHVSALDPESRSAVREMFAPEDLPRNVLYGDGSPIADAEFEAVREAYREATISFPWQRGDALLVDNMLVAHGREPYQGSRKVVVAMTDPCDRTRLAAAGTGAPRT